MQITLKIDITEATRLYTTASAELKAIFEATFGKETFVPKKITEKINTFDDILALLSVNDFTLPYPCPITAEEKSLNALAKLFKIVKAYNEGWEPNFQNKNEYKYYTYKYFSGGRWSVRYGLWFSCCRFPCGLCFKNSTICQDAMVKFKDLYDDYFMI